MSLLTNAPIGALAWILWTVMNRHLDQSKTFNETLLKALEADRASFKEALEGVGKAHTEALEVVHRRITSVRDDLRRADPPSPGALLQKEEKTP